MKKNEERMSEAAQETAGESLKSLRASAASLSLSAAALAVCLVPLTYDQSIGVAGRGIAVGVIIISLLYALKYGLEWRKLHASGAV